MRFKKSQLWPVAKSSKISAIDWMSENIQSDLKIDKNTKIVSMGSCFAREIKRWLLQHEFNYLIGEDKKMPWSSGEIFTGDKGTPPYDHASIAWERVYNTFTFKQIIDYTFLDPRLNDRLYETKIGGKPYVVDLLRGRIVYPNMEVAKKDVLDHIAHSVKMLTDADVLIFTLGLTEIWESKRRNMVVASHPYKHYDLPADFVFRTSKYEENLKNLQDAFKTLKEHNPKLKFLVTVSPVHLLATFRTDLDVISASCSSKSTLRSVAETFAETEDVTYFPSYEIASVAANMDSINAFPDNHHVSPEIVKRIMKIFEKKFVL